MKYEFSAVRPEDQRWSFVALVLALAAVVVAGAWYSLSPRYADIHSAGLPPSPPGVVTAIQVTVRNLSHQPLSSASGVWLSGRYLGADVQAPLERVDIGSLGVGEQRQYSLPIATPTKPGVYRLQVDLVREGVTWFDDLGNRSPVVEVVVQ